MNLIESITSYKRYLRRKNLAMHTVRNYLHRLQLFAIWVAIPIEEVEGDDIKRYIDFLLDKGLAAQSINAHLIAVRRFYSFLIDEERVEQENPVRRGITLRVPSPLPRHLKDRDVECFFQHVSKSRDRAMFMLMLRCGLRVREVANLTIDAVDWRRRRLYVYHGKGDKDRVVYISDDTYAALVAYVKLRLASRV